jgi:hypothetical protein
MSAAHRFFWGLIWILAFQLGQTPVDTIERAIDRWFL